MIFDFFKCLKNRLDKACKKFFGRKAVFRKCDKKLSLMIAMSVIFSGTATYMILSSAESYAKKLSDLKDRTPDYVRYASMGYAFDSVSSKKNVLLSIKGDSGLCRTHIMTFDEDKHTLDILELSPDTLVECDGFKGTLSEAFETPVYKNIVSRMVCLSVNSEVVFDLDAFSDCVTLLGGLKINVEHPITIGETSIAKGKRTMMGSMAKIIAGDGDAYVSSSIERIKVYRQLMASLLKKLNEKGAVVWVSDLLSVIVNQMSTDMQVTEIIELANLSNKIGLDSMNLWLCPGWATEHEGHGIYAVDSQSLAEILDKHFRVKDVTVSRDKLGVPEFEESQEEYKGLKTKIADIK